jgi:hypothetical protein
MTTKWPRHRRNAAITALFPLAGILSSMNVGRVGGLNSLIFRIQLNSKMSRFSNIGFSTRGNHIRRSQRRTVSGTRATQVSVGTACNAETASVAPIGKVSLGFAFGWPGSTAGDRGANLERGAE